MTARDPAHLPRRTRLYGRDAQRRALGLVLENHLGGRGSLIGVEGPPGMGKTALLADFAHTAHVSGSEVVWARATVIDQVRPFGCLLDVLDCGLHHADPARRRVAETMVASASQVIDPFRFDTDTGWRFPVQEAIVDLVLEERDRRPFLLVVDDVQWADAATLGVLLALARRCGSSPLSIAWTMRAGEERTRWGS